LPFSFVFRRYIADRGFFQVEYKPVDKSWFAQLSIFATWNPDDIFIRKYREGNAALTRIQIAEPWIYCQPPELKLQKMAGQYFKH